MTDAPLEAPEARTLRTERLELRPLTRDELDAVRDGLRLPQFHEEFPTPDARDHLEAAEESGAFYFTETLYSPMACQERASGQIVGVAGWAGPPINGALELVGFLVGSRQGQGYASEAIEPLVRLALVDPRVDRVHASVPDESRGIGGFLERVGFEHVSSPGAEEDYQIRRSQVS